MVLFETWSQNTDQGLCLDFSLNNQGNEKTADVKPKYHQRVSLKPHTFSKNVVLLFLGAAGCGKPSQNKNGAILTLLRAGISETLRIFDMPMSAAFNMYIMMMMMMMMMMLLMLMLLLLLLMMMMMMMMMTICRNRPTTLFLPSNGLLGSPKSTENHHVENQLW